ncbi:hypothetical protein SAMN04488053_109113 [Alkalicoccus daliensis]|uniref:Amidase n=2 Tax=Alkalicoccus daliensis TaxID=745820 RepID=A0A1H0HZN3_9BACI|nr:hypothetical protein SAMN04488053_109113 [Alkalicoccus daliensis]
MMLTSTGALSVFASSSETKATWLWNPWMFVQDEAGTLAFLESKKVNKVYVQVDRDVPMQSYRSFIEKATAKNMKIYALDGAPDWAANKGDRHLNTMMKWVGDYQKQAPAAAKFSGIHLDVEPYLLSGWKKNQARTVLDFQKLLMNGKQQAAAMNLPMEADLPFWFDEISYNNTYGKGNLAEWAIEKMDGITLMSYRDSAPMLIEIVKQEMAFGQKHSTPITVGVETMKSYEGNQVSFFEEGEAYMNQQLELVKKHYGGNSAFGGFAVHHVDSWKTLKP